MPKPAWTEEDVLAAANAWHGTMRQRGGQAVVLKYGELCCLLDLLAGLRQADQALVCPRCNRGLPVREELGALVHDEDGNSWWCQAQALRRAPLLPSDGPPEREER